MSLQIQPIVSLAHKLNLNVEEAVMKLVTYFKKMGADFVYDLKLAEDIALLEHQREFLESHRNKRFTFKYFKTSKSKGVNIKITDAYCLKILCQ